MADPGDTPPAGGEAPEAAAPEAEEQKGPRRWLADETGFDVNELRFEGTFNEAVVKKLRNLEARVQHLEG